VRERPAGGSDPAATGRESWPIPLADTDSGVVLVVWVRGTVARLCDERALMVDPLKLFWVITNSTYLGTCERENLEGTQERGTITRPRVFVYAARMVGEKPTAEARIASVIVPCFLHGFPRREAASLALSLMSIIDNARYSRSRGKTAKRPRRGDSYLEEERERRGENVVG